MHAVLRNAKDMPLVGQDTDSDRLKPHAPTNIKYYHGNTNDA